MLNLALLIVGIFAVGLAGTMTMKSASDQPVQTSQSTAIIARGRIEPIGRVIALHGPSEGGVVAELRVAAGLRIDARTLLNPTQTKYSRSAEYRA